MDLWDLMEMLVVRDQQDQLEIRDPGAHWEGQVFLDPRESKVQKEQMDHMEISDLLDNLDPQ